MDQGMDQGEWMNGSGGMDEWIRGKELDNIANFIK
jgi:hypothetical protein